jgi:SAM-dependent methyltransferase
MSDAPPSSVGDVYGEIFREQRPAAIDAHDIVLQHLVSVLPPDPAAPILDAGCGHGRYAHKLLELGRRDVTGADLFDACDVATAPGFRYVQADLAQLPFGEAAFDLVYSNSVIYHLDDPVRAIAEFHRVLRPGGRLLFTAHTRHSLFTLNRLVRMRLGDRSVRHLSQVRFRPTSYYAAALRAQGFRVVRQDGYRLSELAYRARGALRRVPVIGDLARERVTRTKAMARLKSHVAYHMLFIAEKR